MIGWRLNRDLRAVSDDTVPLCDERCLVDPLHPYHPSKTECGKQNREQGLALLDDL
jgi:hypothetical protein